MPFAYAETKEQPLARVRRIEGQILGIARMVEYGKYSGPDNQEKVDEMVGVVERFPRT